MSREDVLLHFLMIEGKMETLLHPYLKWEIQGQNKIIDLPIITNTAKFSLWQRLKTTKPSEI